MNWITVENELTHRSILFDLLTSIAEAFNFILLFSFSCFFCLFLLFYTFSGIDSNTRARCFHTFVNVSSIFRIILFLLLCFFFRFSSASEFSFFFRKHCETMRVNAFMENVCLDDFFDSIKQRTKKAKNIKGKQNLF